MNGQQRHGTTTSAGGAVSDEVAAALRSAGVAEVDFSTRRRAECSSDAANYRLVPAAVVFPRHRDEAAAVAAVWLVILVSNAATTTSRWRSRRSRCCPPSALRL